MEVKSKMSTRVYKMITNTNMSASLKLLKCSAQQALRDVVGVRAGNRLNRNHTGRKRHEKGGGCILEAAELRKHTNIVPCVLCRQEAHCKIQWSVTGTLEVDRAE